MQEPSLELSSQATVLRLAGRYDNPMPTWFLAPPVGLKLPTLVSFYIASFSLESVLNSSINPHRPAKRTESLNSPPECLTSACSVQYIG
jgi:hypothetical protein